MCGFPTLYRFNHIECTRSPVCGLAMLNPGWCHMKRFLENETVLIFGRKNSALIDVSGEILEVKPGRMILLPAGLWHEGAKSIKQPVSYWWVHFYQCRISNEEHTYYLPQKTDSSCGADNSIVLPLTLDVKNSSPYENAFSELLQEYQHPGFTPLIYHSMVERLLLMFASEFNSKISVHTAENKNSATEALVQKIHSLIEDELSNPDASVKYFASLLNLNADYIGRCFKEVTGTSIGQYIQKRRVSLACSRLRETSASVEEVAFQCGFGSRRQFYDEFKRLTGKTPALYRSESAYIGINAL